MSQTIPFGPANVAGIIDPSPVMSTTYTLTIGTSDTDLTTKAIFNCGYCRKVFCAAGTLYIQRQNDGVMNKYVVIAGQYIEGVITHIGGSTTGTTLTSVVLEV